MARKTPDAHAKPLPAFRRPPPPLKPADLTPLIGHTIEVWREGLRTGEVKDAPKTNTLTVKFLHPYGTHRVDLSTVRGVFWYKRLHPVYDWLAARKDLSE